MLFVVNCFIDVVGDLVEFIVVLLIIWLDGDDLEVVIE